MKLILTSLLLAVSFTSASALSLPEIQAKAAQIDKLVSANLEKQKVQSTAPVTDEVFVRRIFLDIAGRIPFLCIGTIDHQRRFDPRLPAGERAGRGAGHHPQRHAVGREPGPEQSAPARRPGRSGMGRSTHPRPACSSALWPGRSGLGRDHL